MKKHHIHIKTQLYISKTYKLQHLLKNLHVINNRNFRTLSLKIQLGKQHIQIQHTQNIVKKCVYQLFPKNASRIILLVKTEPVYWQSKCF